MYNKENKLSCCFREYIYTCVFSNRGILICNRLFKICVKIDSLGFVKQATLIDVVQHSHNDSILLYTLLNMPQWQPAKENGKNIHSSVKFLLHLSPNH